MKNNKSNVVDIGSASRSKLNDEVDELFKLPLAEFTDARNALAKRLKQSNRANDANLVKTLTKPSVSAWTVNQLYWDHRDQFETLLAAGRRVREAQVSGAASRLTEMRSALDARHKALVELSDLATSLLRDSGSNPSPETIRRITTTLEAISALADGPSLGRLTQDVDPPGFESLASFMAGTGTVKASAKPARAKAVEKAAGPTSQKAAAAREAQRVEEMRQAKIAAAKLTLQRAKKLLADARAHAQELESAQKKANAEAKQAEKQLREAEERVKKARTASEAAAERAQNIAEEVDEGTKTVESAKRTVEDAAKELESLFAS
ncbi:MAG TPA: hypothetical protein VGK82_03785 [Pyrinomonadaceae bacterium]